MTPTVTHYRGHYRILLHVSEINLKACSLIIQTKYPTRPEIQTSAQLPMLMLVRQRPTIGYAPEKRHAQCTLWNQPLYQWRRRTRCVCTHC